MRITTLALLLLPTGASSATHLRHGRRMDVDDCPLVNLIQDALTQAGQGLSHFMDEVYFQSEDEADEMGDQIGTMFAGMMEMASEMFAGFNGFSQMIQDEANMASESAYSYMRQSTNLAGEDERTEIIEITEYHNGPDGLTSNKTIETTVTHADGTVTHRVQKFVGPQLEYDSSFDDIMRGYKDVIEQVTPKVLHLSEETAKDVTSAVNEMWEKFQEDTKDMDDEDVLELSNVSKEELVRDYESFSDSYDQLEDEEEIGENEEISKKLDKLANNFAKVVKFA